MSIFRHFFFIMAKKEKRGRLYVVSTHIGNIEDVTIRAIEVLKLCDIVICEEIKEGSILLKNLRINKKLDTLNEQNEDQKVPELINMIIEDDKKIALISDAGTPVFADPGYQLVRNALHSDVNVIVVPDVTSLMTALVRSGFSLDQFLYAGFLSRKHDERIEQLTALANEPRTVAIFDTPYRLIPLLEDAAQVMPHRRVYIGMNLTMPYETHHYGTFTELCEKFKKDRIKAEYVICFEGDELVNDEKIKALKKEWKSTPKRDTFEKKPFTKDRPDKKKFNRDDKGKKPFGKKPFDRDDRGKKPFGKKDFGKKPFGKKKDFNDKKFISRKKPKGE